ncbi:MAG: FHA domain-containing protein [Myxococcota bacterium]
MGRLRDAESGEVLRLAPRTLIGRSRDCGLQLAGSTVSAEHATLWFDAARGWCIRDLASTNGTFVDGVRIDGTEVLTPGSAIVVGSEAARFVLEDDHAPVAFAVSPSGREVEALGDLLALPDADRPALMVHATRLGDWIATDGDGARPIDDGAVVDVAGESWQLHLPRALPATERAGGPRSLHDVSLRFVVSRDEEFVEVSVVDEVAVTVLESRAFHYMLLELARARLEDPQTSEAARGWTSATALAKGLRIELGLLNLHVWRARKQMASLGLRHAGDVVERRGRMGLLRIGMANLVVVRA